MFSRNLRVWLPVWAISLAVVGVTAAGNDATSPRLVLEGRPLQLCVGADAPGLADVFGGKRRAVLVVHSYVPPAEGGASLEVTLTATGVATRIGFFPGGPFKAGTPGDARRYFLPSPKGLAATELCYTVKVLGGVGAAVEVSLELSDELPR